MACLTRWQDREDGAVSQESDRFYNHFAALCYLSSTVSNLEVRGGVGWVMGVGGNAVRS